MNDNQRKRDAYFERKATGRCVRLGCIEPHEASQVLCLQHAIMNAGLAWALRRAQVMQRREKRRCKSQ